MKPSIKIRIIIYFFTLVLPIISMISCPFSSATMSGQCSTGLIQTISNVYGSIMLLSAFLGFIPVAFYLFLVIFITELIADNLNEKDKNKKCKK